MTPSSPFHPPGIHPLSYLPYANNPGVIGEPPGSRRQTPEPAPHPAGNGDILLQLLQGGNGLHKTVADGRLGQAPPHPSAQQQHGIGSVDDASTSWLLDPALASLGPSHPYHQQLLVQQQQQGIVTAGDILHSALLNKQQSLATAQQHQMQPPNLHHQLLQQQQQQSYVSQFTMGQGSIGRPEHFQQQQSSLERAFTGTTSLFPPIQAPVPAPQGVMAPSFSSRYAQGHSEQQRTLDPSWPSPQQVRQPAADAANGVSGRTWAAPQSSTQLHQSQQQRQPQPPFYGNGVDLLQLLLGNTGGAQSSSSPSPSLRAGVDMGVDGKPLQKLSSVVVHGPIGPPKRNDPPVAAGQEDLLGRFWTAPTVAYDLGPKSGLLYQDDHFGQDAILDRSLIKDQLLHVGDMRQSAEHHSLDLRLLGLNMPSLPESEPPGFSYTPANRSSPLLSERLESKDARPFVGGWGGTGEGRIASDRDHTGLAQLQRVIGGHPSAHGRLREDMYLNSIRPSDISVPTAGTHPDSQDHNFKDWTFENDFSRESGRDANRGGRRGGSINSGRGDGSRRGGRFATGQWVAVNDRQREKEVETLHTSAGGFRDQMENVERGSMSGTLLLTKDEGKLRVDEGAPQKIRDDGKRRRGHQQEWRMKQPVQSSNHMLGASPDAQVIDSILTARSSKEAECSDGSSASTSPFRAPSLASQLDHPGLPVSSLPGSSPGTALEESLQHLHAGEDRAQENGFRHALVDDDELRKEEEDELLREFSYLDLDDQDVSVHDNSQQLHAGILTSHEGLEIEPQQDAEETSHLQQRINNNNKPDSHYRPDIEKITLQLLSIYEGLIPLEEEEKRRRQFLSRLEDLVAQDWPGARLFLFGSCANAFGVCNSDIDICLSVNDDQSSKAELVTRMANILRIHNMHNVQALTHARVPIVKFTDPVTGISCDICVNNMLAVVNSKLLHDYSQVDVRLRQLAFIVKHWAKRRQVNETYRGTLSSYAYVLMCIHFLQQRKPAILPCLQQKMPATYQVKIGKIECAYYNKVETLTNFGSQNMETLGELVLAFFEYWAFRHDYNRAVISVRAGSFLSKEQKDWTRRIGNERHLICIEDPFEVTHDLGRVVDRHSIRVLRDEFYRAAKILRHDPNACITLFEPFIRDK